MRKSGLDIIGDVPWGTHFCQYFQTREDLLEILVPYFKAGIEANEFCMWVTAEPLDAQTANRELKKAVPELDKYIASGQIEIIPYTEWYYKGGSFDSERVLKGWVGKLELALEKGYEGLRLTGNTFWLEKTEWQDFADYEKVVDSVIKNYRMIALCSYSLDRCDAAEVIDVVSTHQFALIKKTGRWHLIESSERKLMEEELRRSKEELEKLVEERTVDLAASNKELAEKSRTLEAFFTHSITPMAFLDKNFDFIRVNESYAKSDERDPSEYIGHNHFEFYPSDAKPIFEEVVKTKKPYFVTSRPFEYAGHPERGVTYWDWTLFPILDFKGEVDFLVFSLNNVTERVRAEEELKKYRDHLEDIIAERTEELEAANKELEAFSYSVSHDLRVPLRAVDGFARILMDEYRDQLPPEGQHYLQTICESSQQMGRLIDDLLTFSRLGRAEVSKERVEPLKIVRQAVMELQGEMEGRAISVEIGELPECEADPKLLKQVFLNLISNAIKFTRKRADPRIQIGSLIKDGKPVYFVKDNGVGFDTAYADKLFGVFQRLHRAEEYEGTGVGLAIVKRIVTRHGAAVWAEAEVDKGAAFYFTL